MKNDLIFEIGKWYKSIGGNYYKIIDIVDDRFYLGEQIQGIDFISVDHPRYIKILNKMIFIDDIDQTNEIKHLFPLGYDYKENEFENNKDHVECLIKLLTYE